MKLFKRIIAAATIAAALSAPAFADTLADVTSNGKLAFGGGSVDVQHTISRVMQQVGLAANLVAIEGGLVCLMPYETTRRREKTGKIMQRIADELKRYFEEAPIVVASTRCAGLDDYPSAWDRCNRMISIGRSFGLTGAVSTQDFGPLPMLVSAADVSDVRSFVRESIGAMAEHDREHQTPYLETLSVYLQESCRAQACADRMGLHVTTLRYRLARIQELFGIDVETPDKRFAVELAIRLHRVIDNPVFGEK